MRITPRSMEVLLALASRPGEVMSRDEIFNRVWGDVIVGDEALTRCIADLRKAFSDSPAEPRFIRTVPKKGYCLLPFPAPARPAGSGRPGLPIWGKSSPRSWLVYGLPVVLAALLFLLADGYSRLGTASALPLPSLPLTSFPGIESDPELSPDGRQVAYARRAGGGANLDIFVQDIASGAVRRITEAAALEYSPTWSPDGASLAFLRRQGSECRIVIRSLQGSSERELASCHDNPASDLTWSPSGEWLALTGRQTEGGPFGIYLISPESGQSHLLVAPDGEHWGDKRPAFSPDGKQIAFVRSLGLGAQDLFTISVDGGTPIRLTRDFEFLGGHTWTGQGNSILFSSLRGGQWRLWTVPANGGEPDWLPLTSNQPRSPHVAASQLVFEDLQEDFDLVSFSLQQGASSASQLIDSTRYEGYPQISPSGEQLIFVSDRSGNRELWRHHGEKLEQITHLEGTFTGPPRWYPDEEAILFDSRHDSRSHLYRLDLAAEHLVRLTPSDSNDLFPTLSHDGRTIYFGSDRSGRWQVWKMPATGGEAVAVTHNGGYSGQESGDGAYLYFTRFNQGGLWRMRLDGSEETFLPEASSLTDRTHWLSRPDGLYFTFLEEGCIRLGRIPTVGAPRETLMDLPQQGLGPGISISGDGRRLLISGLKSREQDLILVRLGEGNRERE